MKSSHCISIFFYVLSFLISPPSARAEFILSSAIVEFSAHNPTQQDIELISRSEQSDYITTEIHEIINPGTASESRELRDDPSESGLLVTPEKTILSPGSRRILRFVSLRKPDNKEHIYRVTIKPVVRDISSDSQIGLKILVGYEALVIIRPARIQSSYDVTRSGKQLHITNKGNSNILLQSGKQCLGVDNISCKALPVARVYAGSEATVPLPLDSPVSYAIWDGQKIKEHQSQ